MFYFSLYLHFIQIVCVMVVGIFPFWRGRKLKVYWIKYVIYNVSVPQDNVISRVACVHGVHSSAILIAASFLLFLLLETQRQMLQLLFKNNGLCLCWKSALYRYFLTFRITRDKSLDRQATKDNRERW